MEEELGAVFNATSLHEDGRAGAQGAQLVAGCFEQTGRAFDQSSLFTKAMVCSCTSYCHDTE